MGAVLEEAQENLRLIRDSAAAVAPRDQGPQRARAQRFREPGFDLAMWKEMSALGWAGLRVPEDRGGSGLGVTALCAVAEQLGASLSPEPFIAAACTAPLLPDDTLEAALAGESIVVPAWLERAHDLLPGDQARIKSGRVTGTKRLVVGALGANAFLVATRDGLALVQRSAPGVSIAAVALHDGGFAADVVFTDAPGLPVAGSLQPVLEDASVANAAYLLGAMEAAFDITLEYLKVRKQFGKAIGSFQALQHRAVDMKVQLELTRAVIGEAAAALDAQRGSGEDRLALVSRAKMRAADAAMHIAKESIQFHGAMGMTDESDIGLYARKIMAVHNEWGSVAAHRQRFAVLEQARHD